MPFPQGSQWLQSKASEQGQGAEHPRQDGVPALLVFGRCTPKVILLCSLGYRCNQFTKENHILFSLHGPDAWYLINPGASPEGDWRLWAPGIAMSSPHVGGLTHWRLLEFTSQPHLP